ncbi:MarR family winged helix-turn-helix transcriptional regulator [Aquibaculum arenosum]|uniref:MarR family winged helix-turn-helix transcriptional regulator n=1 Tax=Aquibaculum arenosum TaxID=3032591 RepID=A0ABT5YJZ1_9PROT|nr:MarR family winged helix-turn-helix transcriptional regulator [Fodinicurvata sp. CAU 1616]MDF2095178.1 MarR family winged helix-turn-helix transcriptional regulator [Fodinicurvata sp. CAU 1616]
MSQKDSTSTRRTEVSDELAALVSTINAFSRRLGRKLSRRDPSFRLGDWLLLKRLSGAPSNQMAELAKQLGVSRQRAQKQVAELVMQGYLVTAGDPKDERRKRVELTEQGWERLRSMDALIEAETPEFPPEILSAWRIQLQRMTGLSEKGKASDKGG